MHQQQRNCSLSLGNLMSPWSRTQSSKLMLCPFLSWFVPFLVNFALNNQLNQKINMMVIDSIIPYCLMSLTNLAREFPSNLMFDIMLGISLSEDLSQVEGIFGRILLYRYGLPSSSLPRP